MWFDYLSLLYYFRKDLRNPKYICPENLKKEHDKYVEKKRKRDMKEKQERLRNKIKEAEIHYKRDKQQFFNIHISSGQSTICPLCSVKEFLEESETLKHCVFDNEYYSKKDSLIMSAKVNGIRTETIEISLNKWTIIQCQGYENKNSPFHDKIVQLVKDNIHLIRKASRKNEKKNIHTKSEKVPA
jgi:hypothetical protein